MAHLAIDRRLLRPMLWGVGLAAGLGLLVAGFMTHEPRLFLLLGVAVVLCGFQWGTAGSGAAAVSLSIFSMVSNGDLSGIPAQVSLRVMPLFYAGLWGISAVLTRRLASERIRTQLEQEAVEKVVADTGAKLEKEKRNISGGRQRIEKIFMLTKITEKLSTNLSLSEVVTQVLRGTIELAGHGGKATLMLFEGDAALAYRLERADLVAAREEPDPYSKWVGARLMPLYVQDLSREMRFRGGEEGGSQRKGAVIATPLIRDRVAFGALVVMNDMPEAFSQEDWRLLTLMGDLSSVALQNSQLYQRTQEEALTDGLTGAFVHRHFQERLAEEVKRSIETRVPLTMLMADIDDFKILNDSWGHMTGDVVLREVAKVLREGVRGTDFVARYGGEEFAVLLTETDTDGGMLVAERLRTGVSELSFVEAGVNRPVTISMGVATFHGEGADARELVERADEALYAAKKRGKNCVVRFEGNGK